MPKHKNNYLGPRPYQVRIKVSNVLKAQVQAYYNVPSGGINEGWGFVKLKNKYIWLSLIETNFLDHNYIEREKGHSRVGRWSPHVPE